MDKSKEYIKMCESSLEIQEIQEFKPIISKDLSDGCSESLNDTIWFHGDCNTNNPIQIWLPRQDQLQDMAGGGISLSLIKKFDEWFFTHPDSAGFLDYSMEQLWLAFVMQKKYGKIWNGNDWEKDNG